MLQLTVVRTNYCVVKPTRSDLGSARQRQLWHQFILLYVTVTFVRATLDDLLPEFSRVFLFRIWYDRKVVISF